ncbi:MAG: hypothetical protein ACR2QA_07935 [Solirubrobacteraceae bacterium]
MREIVRSALYRAEQTLLSLIAERVEPATVTHVRSAVRVERARL